MSAKRAAAIIGGAQLVKAPDWPDTRHWHVVSGGNALVVIASSYGGVSRSGRNGWTWWLADPGPGIGPAAGSRPEANREQAAAAGLDAWQRRATTADRR
jgi:hypothetical protein